MNKLLDKKLEKSIPQKKTIEIPFAQRSQIESKVVSRCQAISAADYIFICLNKHKLSPASHCL